MMFSKVFGKLSYDFVWEGEINVKLYGKEYLVKLDINDEDEIGVTKLQEESFLAYKDKEYELGEKIQEAIFQYYTEICTLRREEIDANVLDKLPQISVSADMEKLISPVQFCIPELEENREVILLFDCKWNYNAGMGIKIVNEKVVRVGIQNDVLI